jgi:2-dehydropantoate 2-reductase
MKIGIIGIGAIGGLIAGLIGSKDRHELILCTNSNLQKLEIITNGLTINTPQKDEKVLKINHERFTLNSEIESIEPKWKKSCDLILICTKSISTLNAANIAKELISNHGYCISIQNGIGNENIISSVIGFESVLGGVITHGANKIDSTTINWAGIGEVVIGKMPLTKIEKMKLNEFTELLNNAGLNASNVSDIRLNLWSKLSINAAVNPLAAICGVTNGALLEPALFESACSAMFEVLNVARELGIEMPNNFEMIDLLSQILISTKENRCSMLQDLMKGKITEIDAICGEVIRRAESLGIQTPINSTLMSIISGISFSNTIS